MVPVVSLFFFFDTYCFLRFLPRFGFVFDTINLVLDHLLYPMIG